MQRANAFEVEGVILEVFPNGTCQVELVNGHRLRGFLSRRRGKLSEPRAIGDKVKVSLTPYDLSVGRILTETKTI